MKYLLILAFLLLPLDAKPQGSYIQGSFVKLHRSQLKLRNDARILTGTDDPTSVAKDAERLGDYCKNVFEVGSFYTEDFNVPKYNDPLETIREEVEKLFNRTRRAFSESDEAVAKEAIKMADSIGDNCDEVIEQLLGDSASIETHEAVAYSLLARHYKRSSSHLANICTAVLGRIEDLDFRR